MRHTRDDQTARRAAHLYAPVANEKFRAGKNRIEDLIEQGRREREMWRRLTGITRAIETHLDADERQAHIARLATWITRQVKAKCATGSAVNRSKTDHGLASAAVGEKASLAHHRETEPGPASSTNDKVGATIGCTTDWLPELPDWKSVEYAGLSVEALCEELGMTRTHLTRLLREYCGLSAEEFIDGLRLKNLKHELLTQLKVAARNLWGAPGYQAELLAAGEHPTHIWSLPKKDSKFFQPQPEDWRELNAWRRNSEARVEALHAKLQQLRSGRHDTEIESFGADPDAFDMPTLALKLGLASPKKLNDACVRVFGKRLSKIERKLAQEIVRFYIAAEEKVLRHHALRNDDCAYVARARYLYHGDDERRPSEPFLDAWSAEESFQKDWLKAMLKEFG